MKKITAVCLAVSAWIVLTLCAGAVAFALAVTLRCIMRAWQLGWLLLCSLLFVAVGCRATGTNVNGTTVIFPLQVMTTSSVNRAITITPDLPAAPLINGTNLVGPTAQTVQPVHGVGTAILLPWSYTYRVDGWPGSGHFQVPESTNTLNVVDLLTNAVAIGMPVPGGSGFSGTITNLAFDGIEPVSFTNLITNYVSQIYPNNDFPAGYTEFNQLIWTWNGLEYRNDSFTNSGFGLIASNLWGFYAHGVVVATNGSLLGIYVFESDTSLTNLVTVNATGPAGAEISSITTNVLNTYIRSTNYVSNLSGDLGISFVWDGAAYAADVPFSYITNTVVKIPFTDLKGQTQTNDYHSWAYVGIGVFSTNSTTADSPIGLYDALGGLNVTASGIGPAGGLEDSYITNTVQHFNLETFSNGVLATNIWQ